MTTASHATDVRLAKLLANRGAASRRAAEPIIRAGRVRVNGAVHNDPAVPVPADAQIELDGQLLVERRGARLWRYHKTFGTLVTNADPEGRPTIFDRLPATMPRVISVGRLDAASQGLLLLTDDGALARTLEHPRSQLPRTYRVEIDAPLTQTALDAIAAGLTVDGVHYAPAAVRIDDPGHSPFFCLEMTLVEGKNREIRNMMQFFDRRVRRLVRIAYGPFRLGDLPPDAVRELPTASVRQLQRDLPPVL